MQRPFIYVDRPDRADVTHPIPQGARIAVHLPGRDCLELHVDPRGAWSLNVGPELGKGGEFRTIADGRLLSFPEEQTS